MVTKARGRNSPEVTLNGWFYQCSLFLPRLSIARDCLQVFRQEALSPQITASGSFVPG
jgi:hypothetical protein